MRSLAISLAVVAGACHPRLSVGTDMSATVTGPLARLQPLARLAPTAPAPTAVPPEGRNYSGGIAFGDRRMSIGLRVHANNISDSTLAPATGPRYMSGAAAVDLRWAMISYKGIALVGLLAPSCTALVDTLGGRTSYGEGIRYGGSLQLTFGALGVFADAYQEDLMFLDGPAKGTSTRTGITVGVAFQP